MCQIADMQSNIRRFCASFAVAVAASGAALAQVHGGAEWDPMARQFGGIQGSGTAAPAEPRDTSLDQLNKFLSTSQLPALDRSVYLSIRAFQLSRLGRAADSQKDIVEMAKVRPNDWQLVLFSTMPRLGGGGDRAAALRTLDYGLQRKPNDPWLIIAEAQLYMQLADFSRALGMLDSVVGSSTGLPDRRSALYFRGHANFNLGNFQAAANDFEGALVGTNTVKARLAPLLYRYAAQVHTRQDARAMLIKELGNENLYEWPGPIAKFLIGKLPAGELEVAAESDETAKRSNGKCPAAFFVGMDEVRRGDKQRAREQLQLAQTRCPTVSELNWAASSELKRL